MNAIKAGIQGLPDIGRLMRPARLRTRWSPQAYV